MSYKIDQVYLTYFIPFFYIGISSTALQEDDSPRTSPQAGTDIFLTSGQRSLRRTHFSLRQQGSCGKKVGNYQVERGVLLQIPTAKGLVILTSLSCSQGAPKKNMIPAINGATGQLVEISNRDCVGLYTVRRKSRVQSLL